MGASGRRGPPRAPSNSDGAVNPTAMRGKASNATDHRQPLSVTAVVAVVVGVLYWYLLLAPPHQTARQGSATSSDSHHPSQPKPGFEVLVSSATALSQRSEWEVPCPRTKPSKLAVQGCTPSVTGGNCKRMVMDGLISDTDVATLARFARVRDADIIVVLYDAVAEHYYALDIKNQAFFHTTQHAL